MNAIVPMLIWRLNRFSIAPQQHQRRTRGTAAGTVCGQNTGDPRERVRENTDRHHEIFPYYAHNRPESYFFLQQSHFSFEQLRFNGAKV